MEGKKKVRRTGPLIIIRLAPASMGTDMEHLDLSISSDREMHTIGFRFLTACFMRIPALTRSSKEKKKKGIRHSVPAFRRVIISHFTEVDDIDFVARSGKGPIDDGPG